VNTYGISVTVDAGYPASVERTRTALAGQGFGVLTEIDVAATMKAKLGEEMAPYLILGACNPALAHQALGVDPQSGGSCRATSSSVSSTTGTPSSKP